MVVLIVKKFLCLIGEIPKDEEDKVEKLESSTQELVRFNWARA